MKYLAHWAEIKRGFEFIHFPLRCVFGMHVLGVFFIYLHAIVLTQSRQISIDGLAFKLFWSFHVIVDLVQVFCAGSSTFGSFDVSNAEK